MWCRKTEDDVSKIADAQVFDDQNHAYSVRCGKAQTIFVTTDLYYEANKSNQWLSIQG